MQNIFKKLLLALAAVAVILPGLALAQPHCEGGGHMACPYDQPPIDAAGTAMVEGGHMHSHYFLDVNGDDVADYMLNFGPHDYNPEGRPQDGDAITVSGYLADMPMHEVDEIWVEYLNGELWRECDTTGGARTVRNRTDDGNGPLAISVSPNPFNLQTRMIFTLTAPSEVSLNVYNLAGQVVETKSLGTLPAGEHSVIWSASAEAASGLYFAVINAGNATGNVRMLLLK